MWSLAHIVQQELAKANSERYEDGDGFKVSRSRDGVEPVRDSKSISLSTPDLIGA
jgi:hypothetical protein